MKLVTALLAAGLVAFASDASAHNFGRYAGTNNCKTWYEGRVGLGVRKSKAEDRAARKWRESVALKIGFNYRFWRHAENRHFHCKKKAGTWRCRAVAHPCNQFKQAVPQ
jgi:hypothetical protein